MAIAMIYGSRWWRGVGFQQGSSVLESVDQCGMPVGVARLPGWQDAKMIAWLCLGPRGESCMLSASTLGTPLPEYSTLHNKW